MPLCNIVKFQAVGWSNISLFWMITLPALGLLLWSLTIELNNSPEYRRQPSENQEELEIVLTWITIQQVPKLWKLLIWIGMRFNILVVSKAWGFLIDIYQTLRDITV